MDLKENENFNTASIESLFRISSIIGRHRKDELGNYKKVGKKSWTKKAKTSFKNHWNEPAGKGVVTFFICFLIYATLLAIGGALDKEPFIYLALAFLAIGYSSFIILIIYDFLKNMKLVTSILKSPAGSLISNARKHYTQNIKYINIIRHRNLFYIRHVLSHLKLEH